MLFNSLEYLLFLPLVVACFWLLPAKFRPFFLLVASYWFYMSWIKSYGLLLAALTAINYVLGLAIFKSQEEKIRRIWLVAGLAVNLGCLALFKYTDFIIGSAFNAFGLVSSYVPALAQPTGACPYLNILLPLAISFFVFEFIHYLVDIFRGTKPIKSPLRFALFASFFPSQIAGPIKRYEDFDAQVEAERKFDPGMFHSGIQLILQGMFKKVALGDNLAPIVAAGFSAPASLGATDAWLCVIAFALQIYFDFSGYTDIGRGSAMLLGFNLPINFNLPYLATSLKDFWHRWHISLSTWLRDYLFIPLGGSRCGETRIARNLLITMLLGGLWHGASWHFVIWGGFHGLGLALHRTWERAMGSLSKKNPLVASMRKSIVWSVSAWLITMVTVLIGWTLFRADDLPTALSVIGTMFSLKVCPNPAESITALLSESTLPVAICLYSCFSIIRLMVSQSRSELKGNERGDEKAGDSVRWTSPAFWLSPGMVTRVVAYAGVAFLTLGFSSLRSMPFIYFRF